MKCNHCSAEIADDSTFCEYCGKKIGEESSSASTKKLKLGKKTVRTICIATAGAVVAVILAIFLWPSGTTNLYPISNNDGTQYGFINEEGEVVIYPQYNDIAPFSEGLAKVKINDKYGFIDEKGSLVIPATYAWSRDFSDGRAIVRDGEYRLIDKDGNVIPCSLPYNNIRDFHEGLAAVFNWSQDKNSAGFIDKNGNQVIAMTYDAVGDFSEEIAAVKVNGKGGYIDKNGKLTIPYQFDDVEDFHEGLAAVYLNEKAGYIDKTGKLVIPCQYERAKEFKGDWAAVNVNGKWGFIDKDGKLLINPNYLAADYSQDLAFVWTGEKTAEIIDKSGMTIKALEGYQIWDIIHNNMVMVSWDDASNDYHSHYLYVNKSGKVVYEWDVYRKPNLSPEVTDSTFVE